MLYPLRQEPHPVPDGKNARRYRHALTGVDKDAITARKQWLHRVTLDGGLIGPLFSTGKAAASRPISDDLSQLPLGTFLNKSYPRNHFCYNSLEVPI